MLTSVYLEGSLAQYGGPFEFDVETNAEVLRALTSQVRGFKKTFTVGNWQIVRDDEYPLSYETLHFAPGSTLRIMPAPEGAGGGNSAMLMIGVGALFLASAFTFGATAPAWAVAFDMAIGSGLVLSGVSTLLTPKPESPKTQEERESALFGDIVNAGAAGQPVPVVYGRMMIGSIVISAGILTEALDETD